MATDDRRKHTRVHTVHLVSYTKFSQEKIPELMGMGNTIDLSEGGLRLTVKDPLEVDDVLHLDFEIEGEVVKTDARVVHTDEVKHYNIGFSFEGLSPAARAKIGEYLKKKGFKAK